MTLENGIWDESQKQNSVKSITRELLLGQYQARMVLKVALFGTCVINKASYI